MSRIIRPTLIFVALLLGYLAPPLSAQSASPQPSAKVLVTIVVTEDDSPALGAKVTVRPMGAVEGWPEGKAELSLTTDLAGHASIRLGPGKYKVIAHQSLNIKLPADGWFLIKPGEQRPRKIYLKLLYWDCAHVTCTL
jgi:hypothetical protein